MTLGGGKDQNLGAIMDSGTSPKKKNAQESASLGEKYKPTDRGGDDGRDLKSRTKKGGGKKDRVSPASTKEKETKVRE